VEVSLLEGFDIGSIGLMKILHKIGILIKRTRHGIYALRGGGRGDKKE